jgi:putative transcription factor
MPENTLIKKLEATLNVKLTEGVEDPENVQRRSDSKTMTLGDLIKVRKNKGP